MIWNQKYLIWVIWAKTLKHIWSEQHPVFLLATIGAKTKILKFGTKNAWFEYFLTGIWKECSHTWSRCCRPYPIGKFCERIKMPKFGTKNGFFSYFWTRTLRSYCNIWNQQLRICQNSVFNSSSEFCYKARFF